MSMFWAHKPVRLQTKILKQPKQLGLGIPDYYSYYVASHLNRLVDWCRNAEEKQWVRLKEAMAEIPLENILWSNNIKGGDGKGKTPYEIPQKVCRLACNIWNLSQFQSPLYLVSGKPGLYTRYYKWEI